MDAMTPLGRLIQTRRKERGLTLEALSECTGVMIQTISAIERGGSKRPRFETLNALAKPLELTMNDLADPESALLQPA